MLKKSKKYILAAILIAASVIGGYGCMKSEWENSENRNMSTAGALEYMEQRYGEKFEFIQAHGLHYSKNSRKIFVSCESFPGKKINVEIIKDGKEIKYRDNYMEYYFEDQVNEFIVEIAKGYFDDVTFRISISASIMDSSINLETPFDEYIHSKYCTIGGNIHVSELEDETVREFANELVRRGIHFSLTVRIPETKEWYEIWYFKNSTELEFYRRTLK